jgi:homospermidine synthase
MTIPTAQLTISVLGSAGGVARALLALLNQAAQDTNDPLFPALQHARLHLVDIKQQPREAYMRRYPNLAHRITLHQFDLNDHARLRQHLARTTTSLVVDVSWADTIAMLECCHAMGIAYLNSALENTAVDEDERLFGFPLTERYERLEAVRSDFDGTRAILCSGMNPGVVQWMAVHLLKNHAHERPLACYIVEHDTSMYRDERLIEPETLYSSWSVECFLDEALLSYPMFVRHQTPMYLYEEVYAAEYKVTIGDHSFHGCLMPHEEVLTLGRRFDMELGFLYRVNPVTTASIRSHLGDLDPLWDWQHRIIDPARGTVDGEDLVGVLLVFEDREVYMYNTMASLDIYPQFGTNATYFQVACGLYAGLACLLLDDIPPGAHYVDELLLDTDSRYGSYIARHMKQLVIGENPRSDGLLHQRRKPSAT